MSHEKAYELPKLDYAYDALEPFIDARTMEIHHTKHHATYLTNLKNAEGFDPSIPLEKLLVSDARPVVQNNAGGFYNHNLFWKMMTPNGGGKPHGELLSAIEKKWGTFDAFKEAFSKAGLTQFGSGWAWLVKDHHGALEIIQRPNQNHPDVAHVLPILGLDVWEHAYYLKFQNKRADYISTWWNVVHWEYCRERFNTKF